MFCGLSLSFQFLGKLYNIIIYYIKCQQNEKKIGCKFLCGCEYSIHHYQLCKCCAGMIYRNFIRFARSYELVLQALYNVAYFNAESIIFCLQISRSTICSLCMKTFIGSSLTGNRLFHLLVMTSIPTLLRMPVTIWGKKLKNYHFFLQLRYFAGEQLNLYTFFMHPYGGLIACEIF